MIQKCKICERIRYDSSPETADLPVSETCLGWNSGWHGGPATIECYKLGYERLLAKEATRFKDEWHVNGNP